MSHERLVRIVLCAGFLAGLLLSPRLWLTARFYPLTPIVSRFVPLPPPFDVVAFCGLLALLVLIAAVPKPKVLLVAFLALALLLAFHDQSRWQPWFYQYCLMLLVLAFTGPKQHEAACNTLRVFLIAIYFWSGLAKFNPAFPHGAFMNNLPHALAVAVPALEAALAIGLLIRRYRPYALCAAVAMHSYILWIIGPWGDNYNSVVWPWNLTMIALLTLLFRDPHAATARQILWHPAFPLHQFILLLVALAPALSFVNLWDSYLSFALYSSNSNSADIFLTDDAFEQLPEPLQQYVYEVSHNRNRLSINDWSHGELNVPPYPEPRIFRSVFRGICTLSPDAELVIHLKYSLRDSNRTLTETCYANTAFTTSPPTSVNRKSRP